MIEVWCQTKSSTNQARGDKWIKCHKCCLHCPSKGNCPFETCKHRSKEALCCWKASPAEWMMGRLDAKAKNFAYRRRHREFMLKRGYRPDDGSWEGERLKEWSKNYPKVYKEMLEEYGK